MMKQTGSCLLIVALIFAFIGLFYLNGWYNSFFLSDILVKKYLYEKHSKAVQGLFNYALAICINNFDYLSKKKEKIIIFNENWPPGGQEFKAIINCTGQNDRIFIEAILSVSKSIEKFTITGQLIAQDFPEIGSLKQIRENSSKIQTRKFIVQDWKINV